MTPASPTPTSPAPARHHAPDDTPVIRLRGASFGYADRAVVSGADLVVRPGEALALLGPNGCGKSTLVKGLLGLNDHLGGEVELFGMPLARFRDRHRLGYVPQRHTLSTSVAATVTEVVAAGRLPHQGLLARLRRHDREVIARSLDVVGLADLAREDVSTLSGGQQRRVLIARALAGQPDALVMDEPTAGVDVANQRLLATVLQRLRDRGVGLLIVTHEVDAIAGVLDRVVCMASGRIVFDGTVAELAARSGPDRPQLGDPHHHAHERHGQREPAAGALSRPAAGVGIRSRAEEDERA
ncbi:metal ABC transporter ATP-binding protein [Arsenicicoccus sp. oral taxon 190]|uniref:metal ABC transporter ATP-binding protein n=1 Tax=Arsenicicoccus sp. oral taxon 190 TaxID=1658671 RepID=UPI00209E970E|nr:metal ABC transporter ATP-binding protein [Arsenicicoccus sp. oral taxon 190]